MPRRSTPASAATDPILRIIPLGGVGEIGKNMYVFEYGDEIVVIDCGLMFPDEEMFGIDLVVPDVTYLKERRKKVKAFLITHAHEDHVGGLPYVLPEFPGVPVYASTLARGLLGNKIKEHKLRNNPILRASSPATTVELGVVRGDRLPHRPLHPRRHGHRPAHPGRASSSTPATSSSTTPRSTASCPTSTTLAKLRRGGRALPAVRLDAGREPGLHALRADGRRGLPGDHGGRSTGRVIVATFASNIARIQQVFDAAGDVRPQGRRHRALDGAEHAHRHRPGLPAPTTPACWCPRTASRTSPIDDLVIATTGAQGEPMAGLARMANRDHRFVEIVPGDTVIVSASPIPGNEE